MVGVLVDQDPVLENAKEEIKIVIGMEGNFLIVNTCQYLGS